MWFCIAFPRLVFRFSLGQVQINCFLLAPRGSTSDLPRLLLHRGPTIVVVDYSYACFFISFDEYVISIFNIKFLLSVREEKKKKRKKPSHKNKREHCEYNKNSKTSSCKTSLLHPPLINHQHQDQYHKMIFLDRACSTVGRYFLLAQR